MEFCEGSTLAELLSRHGAFPEDQAKRILGQLASALQFVHDRGVVHRDLKPGNVMLTPSGPRQADGFRPREGRPKGHRGHRDTDGNGARHAAVHAAGPDDRRRVRPTDRRVLVRVHRVRARCGQATLRGANHPRAAAGQADEAPPRLRTRSVPGFHRTCTSSSCKDFKTSRRIASPRSRRSSHGAASSIRSSWGGCSRTDAAIARTHMPTYAFMHANHDGHQRRAHATREEKGCRRRHPPPGRRGRRAAALSLRSRLRRATS